MHVDCIVLSRDTGPLLSVVIDGIAGQQGTQLTLYRVIGTPQREDACRWETIARARNLGKSLGDREWVMFLDDDVVLDPNCVSYLVTGLQAQPLLGAIAADYQSENSPGYVNRHVTMGATLFRRTALRQIKFRWEPDRCECQCCCDDLRRLFIGIDYHPDAHAFHSKIRSD